MASKNKNLAELLDANGDVLATNLDNATITSVSDQDNTSTGSLTVPKGTTAQEPDATDNAGQVRYDTDKGVLTYSNGTTWYKVSAELATLDSVSGDIYAGLAGSGLTLTGTGFLTDDITVNFAQSSDSIDEDVVVTASSDTSATVTVPANVYNNVTAGNVVTITVTNADLSTSSGVTKTAVGLPTGGTITTSGDYRYHTFTSSSSLVVPSGFSTTADYLVVAGGGAGQGTNSSGSGARGGGGAGGVVYGSTTISAGSYTTTVGGGGTSAVDIVGTSTDGGDSQFGSTTTAVGGGGVNLYNSGSIGRDGGSGGGSAYNSTRSSGTSGQGNDGGIQHPSDGAAGGGGGATQQGFDAPAGNEIGGAGGAGTNTYSAWATATSTGDSGYYAGGGGAGKYPSGTGALGGDGGGGNGSGSGQGNAQAGQANTGGGGGGGGSGVAGGNGGSGIIIVRYDTTAL